MQTIKRSLLILFVLISGQLFSQQVIDEIVAVVGDAPIFKSEIETQALQMRSQGYYSNRDINCDVLEEMLFQKLLLKQAIKDSVEVSISEVDNELERRLGVFINQLGSEQKLEEYYEKSILEIKEDFREMIRDQMLTQRMQNQLTADVVVTPSEVRQFFNKIPKDSIPMLSSTYQLKQIVVYPKISQDEKDRCLKKIESYRERVVGGDDFTTIAVLYSDDPGSAPNGGELGFVARTDLVPEFAAAAFTLSEIGDISRVVETEFGYHILQLIEKKGSLVNVRHILVTPKTDRKSENKAKSDLEAIRNKVLADSISFEKAAQKYSEDESTANSGGTMFNQATGKPTYEESDLDPLSKDIVRQLAEGEVSKIIKTRDDRGKSIYKFIKLQRKIVEHKANLKEDYQKYQEETLAKKKQDKIETWIKEALDVTYVRIDSSYVNCDFQYADWIKK
jgi:peptidyl-prolyl cis-trans isomerase SurA